LQWPLVAKYFVRYGGKVEAVRKRWTDERLDDLNHRVDDGFRRVEDDEVDARFEAMGARFENLNDRFDRLNRLIISIGGGAIATFVASLMLSPL